MERKSIEIHLPAKVHGNPQVGRAIGLHDPDSAVLEQARDESYRYTSQCWQREEFLT
jgi:hypothetical protein